MYCGKAFLSLCLFHQKGGSIMSTFVTVIFSALILFPFPIAFGYLFLMKKKGYAPASTIGRAADWTTPFLFLAVYILAQTVIGPDVGISIVLIAIVLAIVYAIIERLRVKDFQIGRIIRKCWRLYFLLLTGSYITLIVAGVVLQLMDYFK